MPDVVDIAVGRRRRADRDRARLRSEVLDVMRRTREIMGRTVAVRSTEVDLGVVLVASCSRRPARIDGLSVTMNVPPSRRRPTSVCPWSWEQERPRP